MHSNWNSFLHPVLDQSKYNSNIIRVKSISIVAPCLLKKQGHPVTNFKILWQISFILKRACHLKNQLCEHVPVNCGVYYFFVVWTKFDASEMSHSFLFLESQDSGYLYFCFRWLLIRFKREFSFQDILRLWEVRKYFIT